MKTLIALAILATSVFGETITLRKDFYLDFDSYYMEFNANPELDRAWVEIESVEEAWDWDDDDTSTIDRIKVKNLVYSDNEIIYKGENGDVVCAVGQLRGVWRFKKLYWNKTGNCYLNIVNKTVEIDDSFWVKQRKLSFLNLEILD
ncbi:MAG: hypothetical protein KC478_06955 [Bacteriovoracaceae bacterium]|nr:hypothetical protein [Bacteriovoracaceae bacterium]